MSRTIRRRKDKWKFHQVVGSFEEFTGPCPGYPNSKTWEQGQSEKSGVSLEKMYDQWVAFFYRDSNPGQRGAPRWFRRMYGSKHVRLVNQHQLHICNKYDEWDQHVPLLFVNNAG